MDVPQRWTILASLTFCLVAVTIVVHLKLTSATTDELSH
jgi:hypothetical protein